MTRKNSGMLAWLVVSLATAAGTGAVQAQPSGAPEIRARYWFNTCTAPSLQAAQGRPVVVVFLTTRCPYCVQAIPILKRLDAMMRSSGGAVIALSPDSNDQVRDFVARCGVTFMMGSESDTYRFYGVRGVPHAFLIRGGQIVWQGHPSNLLQCGAGGCGVR